MVAGSWFFATALLVYVIRVLCRHVSFLRRHLLLLDPASSAADVELAVFAFAFFVQTATFGTVWYALRFDPTGTYLPSWTGHLG